MSHLSKMRDFASLYDVINKNHTTKSGLSDIDLMNYIESIKKILTGLRIGLVDILEQA